jgi:hypothetical protein
VDAATTPNLMEDESIATTMVCAQLTAASQANVSSSYVPSRYFA